MKSMLAEAAELRLIEAAKAMTHEQRLRAFIELSKRMVELQQAGKMHQRDSSRGRQSKGVE